MAAIVLVKFDRAVAITVAQLFCGRRHRVILADADRSLAPTLDCRDAPLDLIVLDVSVDDASTRKRLAEINRFRAQHGPRPMLLCVSRVYRGPRFELEIERKGARLVYVR